MPNTPALAGVAVSAYCVSEGVTAEDKYFAEKLLESFGSCFAVEEKLMDAVTGLSGSGPAYVFDFIQGLVDGAVREGLPRDKAIVMAAQTVFGAAKMLIDAGEHPAVLKDSVTSPAGTTAEALAVLEKGAFRGLVAEAVKAATERSRQLGRK
jgi:pyrroline-5-carboxylate reductase